MNSKPLFVLELTLSLASSLAALALLRGVLVSVLKDLCGTTTRARFWTRFTQLMLLIGPLLGTLVLADGATGPLDTPQLRQTLRHVLAGLFVTLAGIGWVIWRSIPTPPQPPTPYPPRTPDPDAPLPEPRTGPRNPANGASS